MSHAWPTRPFTRRGGPKTTLDFHRELVDSAEFISGDYDTHIAGRLRPGVK